MSDVETVQPTGQRVGEPLPTALGPTDLMKALNLTRSAFYSHHRKGLFRRFEFPRAIGIKKYSGHLVQAYLDGGKGR